MADNLTVFFDAKTAAPKEGPKSTGAPTFLKTLQPTRGTVGSLIKLDVRVKGAKPIQVHWLMDGDELQDDMTHKTVEEDDLFTLLILEASSMDKGIYEVIAVNSIGEARCQATVDVVPVGGMTSPPNLEKAKPLPEKF